ncbi:MAG TPA: hypothetical protein VF472_17780 [Burkholderiaceae bacterium]
MFPAKPEPTADGKRAYDVFNGDADGLCALHQLRLAEPRDAVLVTGAKRDIALLPRVPPEQAGEVCVLDISFDSNAEALRALLDAGCRVRYFDHHAALQAFEHENLEMHWDESPEACTSILVDRYLQGKYRSWAIAAAFGDNLDAVAQAMAQDLGMTQQQMDALQRLGTVLNYNAYGENVADLHIDPEALFRAMQPYADPFDFISRAAEYRTLVDGYREDAHRMDSLEPSWSAACGDIYVLPDAAWARRISGIFANKLAAAGAGRSFAVLTGQSGGCFGVSVRSGAPNEAPAHRFCEGFESGGGRKLAAGVNRLPAQDVDTFRDRFFSYFGAAAH